ncbi:hypothetical protein KAR91_65885 [Candidatus Pacearchaeota archaeon]|nr:hypothetical protein [Candidatus Pacearchaeota archaeon]
MTDPFEDDQDVQRSVGMAGKYIKESMIDSLSKDKLLNIDTKLSGHYSYLQTKAAYYQLQMNSDYWHRKIEYSRAAIKERATKMAQNKLDHLAIIEVAEKIEIANLSAFRYEYLHRFLMGISTTINSVKKRLRWMEIEYHLQQKQT